MKTTIFLMISAMLLLAACTQETQINPAPNAPDNTSAGNTGLANPASVYCEKQGGTLKIVDQSAGQVGMCTLPDGTVCEEWAYYRRECPAATNASCGTCPTLSPPAPGFCDGGTILPGKTDACGCTGAPICQMNIPEPAAPVACTMDAKACPDGSFVGRVPPDCSFAPCPGPAQN